MHAPYHERIEMHRTLIAARVVPDRTDIHGNARQPAHGCTRTACVQTTCHRANDPAALASYSYSRGYEASEIVRITQSEVS